MAFSTSASVACQSLNDRDSHPPPDRLALLSTFVDITSLVPHLRILGCIDDIGMVQRDLPAAEQDSVDRLDAQHQGVVLIRNLVPIRPESSTAPDSVLTKLWQRLLKH